MPEINNGEFTCELCNAINNINYNIGSEWIDGIKFSTRQCHSCDAKYKKSDGVLQLIKNTNAQEVQDYDFGHEEEETSERSPMALFIILGLFLLSGLFFVMDYFSEGNNSAIAKSISNIVPAEAEENKKPNQYLEENKCDYTNARKKALLKLENEGLSYVGDDNGGAEEDKLNCKIRYRFFVKKVNYDLNGNQYLADKVQLAFLTYKLIGDDYEYVDGQLMDGINSTSYRPIN